MFGLAGVQGAITLTWVIYILYLPKLLELFGFPATIGATLAIVENLLGAAMEPLMGGLSDRARRWAGTKLPFITVGVILASVLFIAIPTVVTFGNPTSAIRWVLLVAIISWFLAMTVFRSPVISLLGQYATPAALPLAVSVLILSGGVVNAFRPFVNQLIVRQGPIVPFAIGSFVLLGAAALLRLVHPPDTPTSFAQSSESSPQPMLYALVLNLGLIFVTAVSVTWGSSFLMDTLQKVVQTRNGAANLDWIKFAIALALAIAALPAGAIATKLGNQRAMLLGIGATIGAMLLMVLLPNLLLAIAVILILVFTFSLIVNGVIPFALSLVPPHRGGLGIGMYFGGASVAGGQFGVVFPRLSQMTPIMSAVWGTIAFIVAGLCIAASTKNSTAVVSRDR